MTSATKTKKKANEITTIEQAVHKRQFPTRKTLIEATCDNMQLNYDIYLDSMGRLIQDEEAIGNLIKIGRKPISIIANADNPDAAYLECFDDSTQLSYECLCRFFGDATTSDVCAMFAKGELRIIDKDQASTYTITKRDYEAHVRYLSGETTRAKAAIPPDYGYTLITPGYCDPYWHKSGTVLLKATFKSRKSYFKVDQYIKSQQDMYILLGQDDGTYFGVELPKPCRTLPSAYKTLMPKEAIGKYHLRQGEWFLVPCKESDAPKTKDCFEVVSKLILPRKDESSNQHILGASDIRIRKSDGVIFADTGDVTHSQHPTVSFSGWVTFHENTAVRSFSVDGVD